MKILALDIGTTTGWAFNIGEQVFYGKWDLKPSRHEGAGMRWIKLRNSLDKIIGSNLVVYEEVAAHKGTAAAHIYGGLIAIVQSWCDEKKVNYTSVPVGTIKKHATGKGNAGKKQMIEAANAKFKLKLSERDHDIADAMWILDWALEEFTNEAK